MTNLQKNLNQEYGKNEGHSSTIEQDKPQDDFTNAVELINKKRPFIPEHEKFTYYDKVGESIYNLLTDINFEIVSLHDEVQNNVFTDIDYYSIVGLLPIWLRDAGNSQESSMSRSFFEKIVGANNSYLINKCLYYYDCEMLVDALQNRFNIVEVMLTQLFTILTPSKKFNIKDYDEVIYTIDDSSQRVQAYINSIIINLASSCDIMTKIAIELLSMSKVQYNTYPKMTSTNITYGNIGRLPAELRRDGTYFAAIRPIAIMMVESIRDEIVHNGSLDFHSTVYYGTKGENVETWLLMPAFNENGTLTSYHGRKKFYEDPERTVNKELPLLVKEFLTIALATIQMIGRHFRKPYYSNSEDLKKYHDVIIKLTDTYRMIASKELNKDATVNKNI